MKLRYVKVNQRPAFGPAWRFGRRSPSAEPRSRLGVLETVAGQRGWSSGSSSAKGSLRVFKSF